MKGFGIIEHREKMGFIEKETPQPRLFEALCEPVAIAPCTSDVHVALHRAKNPALNGRILGHESVGRIVKLGEGVKEYKVGDIVAVPATTPDWRTLEVQDERSQHSGGPFQGMKISTSMDGSMAEYFIVPDVEMNTALVTPDISIENALMACDMVTTGFHGAELAEVRYGDTVVVLGIGPVGLMAIAGSVLRGAGRVIGVGSRPALCEMAKHYGVSDLVNYKNGDVVEQIFELTGGKKVDCVIVCGGEEDNIDKGCALTKANGVIANMVAHSNCEFVPIRAASAYRFVAHQKIVGGLCPGGRRRMERIFEMVRYGRVDPSLMVSHKFQGLEGCEPAFYLMDANPADLIKPVVYF